MSHGGDDSPAAAELLEMAAADLGLIDEADLAEHAPIYERMHARLAQALESTVRPPRPGSAG